MASSHFRGISIGTYVEGFHYDEIRPIFYFSFIVMYVILPETEGRSLEDIELHYADNAKTIADRNIEIQRDPQ